VVDASGGTYLFRDVIPASQAIPHQPAVPRKAKRT
jgi:hypothetical protein